MSFGFLLVAYHKNICKSHRLARSFDPYFLTATRILLATRLHMLSSASLVLPSWSHLFVFFWKKCFSVSFEIKFWAHSSLWIYASSMVHLVTHSCTIANVLIISSVAYNGGTHSIWGHFPLQLCLSHMLPVVGTSTSCLLGVEPWSGESEFHEGQVSEVFQNMITSFEIFLDWMAGDVCRRQAYNNVIKYNPAFSSWNGCPGTRPSFSGSTAQSQDFHHIHHHLI